MVQVVGRRRGAGVIMASAAPAQWWEMDGRRRRMLGAVGDCFVVLMGGWGPAMGRPMPELTSRRDRALQGAPIVWSQVVYI